jgi:hypothetical protein
VYPHYYFVRRKFTLEGFDRFTHVAICTLQIYTGRNSVDLVLVQDTYFKRAEKKVEKHRQTEDSGVG